MPAHRHLQLNGLNAIQACSVARLSEIDTEASLRIHVVLIADDQSLCKSHLEKLRVNAALATEWVLSTGQEYHVDKPDKTAVLLMGQAGQYAHTMRIQFTWPVE